MSPGNLSIRTRLTVLLVFVNVLMLSAAGYAWFALASACVLRLTMVSRPGS